MIARSGAHTILPALGVLLCALTARGQDAPKAEQKPAPGSPAARVAELQKEFDDGMRAFQEKYTKAKTDEERSKLFEELYPNPEKFTGRFFAIAKEHPTDPAAFDALVWVVQRSGGANDPTVGAAIKQLARDHVTNPKLTEMIPSLVYGPPSARALLETVLEKNPDTAAKAQACFALAQKVKQEADYARRIQSDKAMRATFEQVYGKVEAERLSTANIEDLQKQAEGLFERVSNEFADVRGGRGPLGEAAARELFEIRNLAIGKVAPEIEGEDIDGKPFKLSDYRGKVVLLDFWGDW